MAADRFELNIDLDDAGGERAAPMPGHILARHLRELANLVEPWSILHQGHGRDVKDERGRAIGHWEFS